MKRRYLQRRLWRRGFRIRFRIKGRGQVMKRTQYAMLAAGIVLALSTAGLLRSRGREAPTAAVKTSLNDNSLIAAPGRVEAVSEEVRVSSELSGRLKSVNVEEGDRVRQGQVLAEIQ